MAPLIPNGVYKIRNGEFHTFVAALRHGNPHGPIVAQTAYPSNKHDKVRAVLRGRNLLIGLIV